MDCEKMQGADDGLRTNDRTSKNDDDNAEISSRSSSSDCSRIAPDITARVHPFQEILEQHGEYGFSYDTNVGESNNTSSTNDESVPSEEAVSNDLLEIQNRALLIWNEALVDQELLTADDTESAQHNHDAAIEDAAMSSEPDQGEQTVDMRDTIRRIEESLFQESAADFATEEEIVSAGENAQNESAHTNRLSQPDFAPEEEIRESAQNESEGANSLSQNVEEEHVSVEAILDVLNNDVDEIMSENAVALATMVKNDRGEEAEEAASLSGDEEGDNDANTPDEIRPGAQHVYPSLPSVAEDSREDDASDVVYDLFDRPASPCTAEVIPEAIPVDLERSFDYCANVNSAAVPQSAMSFTSELKNMDTLLRRQVLVDDIISKLQEASFMDASEDCDESQNVVLLQGYGGIGKSVLSSMVVSNRSTLLHFADGIVWLSLSQVRGEGIRGGMTYDVYVDYLESICNQLDLEVPTFNEPIVLAADSSSIRRQKQQAAMEAAKHAMCRLLSNRHILIVLDDVWSRSAIPWLNFSNRLDSHLRVLLSTRLRGGFRKAKIINVGTLSLQEARSLLIRESGCQHAALTSEEESLAVDIAERCSLPIAICIAGRRLTSSNNRYESFRELANEMSDALALQIDSKGAMFDLTDRCFAGVSGESLKASFVAFAVTFTTNDGKRAFVPAAAATKLLDALLLPKDITDLACVNGTVLILQQLHDMGLLERQGDMFKVRHELGREYAKQIMSDQRERAILFTKRLSRTFGKKQATKSTKCVGALVSALHLLFARECTSEISIESYWQAVADDGYLFERLPWHLLSSTHQKSHLLARSILCSPSFLKRRVGAMGMLPCIKAHIHDMEMLGGKSHTKKEQARFQRRADTSFEVILDYISTEGITPQDAGRAYMLLALYFQQHFRFSHAMEMYSRAHASFQREGLDEEVEWVKKRAEKIAFKPLCLVPKSTSSEDIIRFDRVPMLLAQQENAASELQHTDTDTSSHASADAGIKLTLSSHPGMALCLSDQQQHLPGWNFRNLVIGPTESAVSVRYEGDRFMGCHGGRSCLTAGASRGGEGDMLHLASYKYNNKTFSRTIDKIYEKTTTSDLIVNEDGSMSPRSRRDLVFAARLSHFFLVKRDSPCRLIFKHGNDLQTNQVPSISQDCTVSRDKIFSGELLSHPGNAICHDVEVKTTSKVSGDQMRFGDVSESIQFVYDGKKLATVIDGKCKYFLTQSLGVGDATTNLYLVRDESKAIFKNPFEFGLHWIINADGSLSPAEYPTHAIGIYCVSGTELMLTDEQQVLAKSAAKRRVEKSRGLSIIHKLRFLRLISG